MNIRALYGIWRFPPRLAWLSSFLLLAVALALPGHAHAEGRQVWVLELDGPIGPASSDYITRNLAAAEAADVALFVIRMNTPGGLDQSMRDIIRAILDADVPVATWVAPGGSRAASAGTYILYASHIAAMAPATNLGAATPVAIGGGGSPLPTPGGGDEDDEEEASGRSGTASDRKAINDAVAYIRGLAELRGRNADWAEAAVRDAVSLSASDALAEGVIDLIAKDVETLLAGVDGRHITLERGEVTLDLAGAEVISIEPDWRSEFLGLITNPNIAYILLMIGIYGLILEFYNPGLGIPGVTGIICLLLAFYALQMLPISYVGVALLIIGIALMITEAFAPSFGVFGVGGAVAFVIGSVMLMDSDLPGYQISLPLIAAFAVGSLAIFVFSIGAALRARRHEVVSGREGMIGAPAVAVSDFETRDGMEHGRVRVHGEIWQAESPFTVTKGQHLRVTGLDGLIIQVQAESSPAPAAG
ncbi:MAG: nodulation protein NfeD [Gammaproteobacteria bacterium]|nr:nodulation protein NfeD [Gammaproteobacteria bacterium]